MSIYLIWFELKGKITYYYVDFFGSKKETGQYTSSKLNSYEENKQKYATGKIMENKDFVQAVKVIENEIKANKNISNLNSPMSFSASTPKTSKLGLDCTLSLDSSSSKLIDKSVNTTIELDQNFQLEALTENCIDLEKQLMHYKEKINLILENENTLKNENNLLKSENFELKQNLKCLEQNPVNPTIPQHDFQTQILLTELKAKELENENLKAASKILQEEMNSLGKKLEDLQKISNSYCFNCFPSMQQSQPTLTIALDLLYLPGLKSRIHRKKPAGLKSLSYQLTYHVLTVLPFWQMMSRRMGKMCQKKLEMDNLTEDGNI